MSARAVMIQGTASDAGKSVVVAGLPPRTDFNPVLLKPQTDRGAQVVVHGQPVGMLHAAD